MHKSVLSLVCCLFFFLSCEEEIETMPNGSLNIVLTDGAAVTRTLPDALSDELRQQFTIELLRDREGTIVPEYKGALRDFGDQRVFKVGSYQLKAYLGENPSLALDAPYYYGEVQDIAIEKGKATTVTVGCKVANALATFEIVNQEDFEIRLKNYYVAITVGDRTVTWKPGDTTHPYFRAGSQVALSLVATSTETGVESSYALTSIATAEAGIKYNYKLSMKVSPDAGSIFDITTDAQKEPVTVNETVPEQWLPKPKITAEGFDKTNVLTYTETADAVPAIISYQAVRAVQDIEFTLNFADENLSSLNKVYTLSTLSPEDRQALEAAHITLPEKNTATGSFDFTQLTAGLLTQNGGQEVDNQIKVKVMANGRWSEEATYLIKTVKPEFKVAVYPGTIWTKEFSVDLNVSKGNIDRIKDYLTIEWSQDGSIWEKVDKTTLCCAGLEQNTPYWLRVKYRYGDFVTQKFKTYSQIPLENGELTGGSVRSGTADKNNSKYGALYEWNGWSTLNELTCDKCTIIISWGNTAFSSRSGTRPSTSVPTGSNCNSSVWIMTMGYGYGNWDGPKYYTPSELFLGSYASGTKNYGIDFNSRPTAVSFYYKYAPYNEDTSDIFVQILSGTTIIGKGKFNQTKTITDFTNYTMNIAYDEQYKELVPDKLILVFKSGVNTDVHDYGTWSKMGTNSSEPAFRGSELYVADIKLIYGK